MRMNIYILIRCWFIDIIHLEQKSHATSDNSTEDTSVNQVVGGVSSLDRSGSGGGSVSTVGVVGGDVSGHSRGGKSDDKNLGLHF